MTTCCPSFRTGNVSQDINSTRKTYEVLTVLAHVGGSGGGNIRAPESALDVGGRERVGASGGRELERVALVVNVEGHAAGKAVAVAGAGGGVVGLEGIISHVISLRRGAVQVAEGRVVAGRRRGQEGGDGVERVQLEGGVGERWWAVAERLEAAVGGRVGAEALAADERRGGSEAGEEEGSEHLDG